MINLYSICLSLHIMKSVLINIDLIVVVGVKWRVNERKNRFIWIAFENNETLEINFQWTYSSNTNNIYDSKTFSERLHTQAHNIVNNVWRDSFYICILFRGKMFNWYSTIEIHYFELNWFIEIKRIDRQNTHKLNKWQ